MTSKPNVNISIASASNVLNIGVRRDLIVCQTPGASANTLVKDMQSKTQTELNTLLGAGSYARFMVQAWLDANRSGNNYGAELDMITLKEEGAAVAAATVLTIASTATEAGTMVVSILSSELFKKEIAIESGDIHTVVSAAIETAFTGVVAPFAVVDAAGTLTITATDKGTIGMDYGIEISGVPAGLTATITPPASGATPPIVTNVMDLVGDRRYQGVVWPTDLDASLEAELSDFLDARFNTSNDILDGVAFMGFTNTLTLSKAEANALNSQSTVLVGNAVSNFVTNPEKSGPEVLHPVDWITASFVGIRSRRLTENASIGSVIVANATNDQFGSKSLASLPYFNTPLASVPVTDAIGVFSQIDQAELNASGFTVMGPNRPQTETIMGSVVTTYKTDTSGNEDVSFKYLNYVDTASVCREYFFNNLSSTFKQSRLTDGDLLQGRSMENSASIEAVVQGLFADLKEAALIRKGREADALISDSLTVTLDLANRKATISSVLPIVTQLETINTTLQLTFTV